MKKLSAEESEKLGFDRIVEDLRGLVFGKLKVVDNLPKPSETDHPLDNKNRRVLVKCECGATDPFEARVDNLRNGKTASCGCGWKSHIQKWRTRKLTNPPKKYKKMAAAK